MLVVLEQVSRKALAGILHVLGSMKLHLGRSNVGHVGVVSPCSTFAILIIIISIKY